MKESFFHRFHFFVLEICWLNLQDFWDPGGDKSRISIISCIFIPRNWTLTLLETLQYLHITSSWSWCQKITNFFQNLWKYDLEVLGAFIQSLRRCLSCLESRKETSLFINKRWNISNFQTYRRKEKGEWINSLLQKTAKLFFSFSIDAKSSGCQSVVDEVCFNDASLNLNDGVKLVPRWENV